MADIKFSIAIPAYKRLYLKEAIDSCLSQTYNNFELIIVNDASPEDLSSIIDEYDDARIFYYINEKNCGAINVVDNWNKCLRYATGQYIICMGDDDRLLPCCLEEYLKLIRLYPNLGIYHAWTEIIDENGEFYKFQHPRPIFEGACSLCWNRWNGRGLQYIGDFCYDVAKLRQDGGFYKLPMAWASDDISAVRAAQYGGVANSQVLCFQYRRNRQSISLSGNQKTKIEATRLEKVWFENFIKGYNPESYVEIKYHKMIKESIDQHFKDKYKMEMSLDIKTNILNFFYWLSHRKRIGVSIWRVIEALEIAIKNRFHGL
jgi:glycosyltransferase involved in cell wall biosynthesis